MGALRVSLLKKPLPKKYIDFFFQPHFLHDRIVRTVACLTGNPGKPVQCKQTKPLNTVHNAAMQHDKAGEEDQFNSNIHSIQVLDELNPL